MWRARQQTPCPALCLHRQHQPRSLLSHEQISERQADSQASHSVTKIKSARRAAPQTQQAPHSDTRQHDHRPCHHRLSVGPSGHSGAASQRAPRRTALRPSCCMSHAHTITHARPCAQQRRTDTLGAPGAADVGTHGACRPGPGTNTQHGPLPCSLLWCSAMQ